MPSAPEASRDLAALLGRYSKEVQEITQAARRYLFTALPGANEVVDAKAGVIGYGYGKGYRDMVCTLILSRTEVKLGLVGGAAFADPRRLLRGAGRVHRHVPLASTKDLSRPGLKTLVKTALSTWRHRSR